MNKGVNGTGNSVTVYFDTTDPAERKALEAAQMLASKHGRRKQAIVALLEAVYNVYETSGELLSATEISAALIGQMGSVSRQTPKFESADITPVKRDIHHKPKNTSSIIEISDLAGKASAGLVADNFLKSISGLTAGFFD